MAFARHSLVRLEAGMPYVIKCASQIARPCAGMRRVGPLFPDIYGDLAFQPFGMDRTQMT